MTIKERNAADQDFITREALRIKREKKQKKVNPDQANQNKSRKRSR